jgi:uncharacterized OB-fold protein
MKSISDLNAFAGVGGVTEETLPMPVAIKPAVRKRRSVRTSKKMSKRSCRLCGKDPFPNYFFCPSCHHRITSGEAEAEA